MARMIPNDVHTGTPMSERRIFEFLKLDPGTKDWTVLHSLGLRETRIGPYGEIDFVILAPGLGILCLEVKGGSVSCHDGIWETVNRATGRTTALKKSPYLQAREGMFALIKSVREYFPQSDSANFCLFSCAVVFPDVIAPPNMESQPWESFDCEDLKNPISKLVEKNLLKAREGVGKKLGSESVSPASLTAIRKFLRPDFDLVISRSTLIGRTEEQLVSLTEEQYYYLDIADINDRALVTGAAGTGKTLLALEYAKREASSGKSVLLICFNRLLGNWLSEESRRSDIKSLTADTYYSYIRKVILASSFELEFEQRAKEATSRVLYDELFPFYAELALNEVSQPFDTLIIDEVQDLIIANKLSCVNLMVKGGLAKGRWAMFGDFARQSIYGNSVQRDERQSIQLLREHCDSFPVIPLRLNCRNTRQIGEETALLSGFDSLPYRLGHIVGSAVDYKYWHDTGDEVLQLERTLIKLLDDGVKAQEIVILSPNKFEHSAAFQLKQSLPVSIVDVSAQTGQISKCIFYSTIHAFKGMESSVVVICGVLAASTDEQRSLLYVGMSRARSHLSIIANEKLKVILPQMISQKLAKDWSK